MVKSKAGCLVLLYLVAAPAACNGVEESSTGDAAAATPDAATVIAETGGADAPRPDKPKPDAPRPDAAQADAPRSDAPVADAPRPDAPLPDLPLPDLPLPDLPLPDLPLPDAVGPQKPWAVALGGAESERARAIARGSAGNFYIAGQFQQKTTIGTHTFDNGGACWAWPGPTSCDEPIDIFVAKLNRQGKVQWAMAAMGADAWEENHANGLTVDGKGNVTVAGWFYTAISFGSTKLGSGLSGWNTFVTRLDAGGKVLWAVDAGGSGSGSAAVTRGLAQDGAGNSYVTGYLQRTVSFGSTTLSSTSKNTDDLFVAKLDNSGTFLWAVAATGAGNIQGSGIATDSAGNSTITGHFSGSASFGSTTLSAKGSQDLLVARLDKTGKFLWAASGGGSGTTTASGVAHHGTAGSTITGYFTKNASFGSTTLSSKGGEDLLVARVDEKGKFLWAVSGGGSSTDGDRGQAIAAGKAGESIVTGRFAGTASFGSTTLTSFNKSVDIFVARLDSNGKWLWVAPAVGAGEDVGLAVTADSSDDGTIAGYFNSNVLFGSTSLSAQGGQDVFVARVHSSWAQSGTSPACSACCKKCNTGLKACDSACSTKWYNDVQSCKSDQYKCLQNCGSDSGVSSCCMCCDYSFNTCFASAGTSETYCLSSCKSSHQQCLMACACACP